MFEELYMPVPDIGKFLERIGLSGYEPEATLECLDTLIKAYVTHVPFENLTVAYFHEIPSLGIEDLYTKMILSPRGGYCHEMSGLFLAFLKTLGFEAYSVSVYVREDLDFLPDLGHRSNICVLDGRKYFVEVGYGGSAPVCAVPLDGEHRGGYFLTFNNNEYHVFKEMPGHEPKEVLMFRDFLAYPVEFVLANKGIAYDPLNKFRKDIIVNFCNPEGEIYQIYNDIFKYKTKTGKGNLIIKSDDEFRCLLGKYFGIRIKEKPENN